MAGQGTGQGVPSPSHHGPEHLNANGPADDLEAPSGWNLPPSPGTSALVSLNPMLDSLDVPESTNCSELVRDGPVALDGIPPVDECRSFVGQLIGETRETWPPAAPINRREPEPMIAARQSWSRLQHQGLANTFTTQQAVDVFQPLPRIWGRSNVHLHRGLNARFGLSGVQNKLWRPPQRNAQGLPGLPPKRTRNARVQMSAVCRHELRQLPKLPFRTAQSCGPAMLTLTRTHSKWA